MISITISIDGIPDDIREIIRSAILLEKIDERYVSITDPLNIKIKAEAISRGRAIMNSYIFWLYTILRTLEEVDKSGRKNSP
ncbi:family 52 olfactory receptor [Acidianus sp. HS-5]|uniref:family 52 olfactory receptor n=1 Tax=Acidianus sp. HS-5 TaxID=2886040 RepID=UPI001F1ECABA|nr:family 52 olfactory receptor [Acidianus sp. HS-5]BDC19319.1 KEOPS complex Pcc1-like subunit [Acidianus sp. HS-5]